MRAVRTPESQGTTEETLSIGELASRSGLPVRTVRYYSEIGLLKEAGRSAGGHRRYTPSQLERLWLIRRLRALETPVTAIARVLAGERTLSDLVAAELEAVQGELRRLNRRRATLHALHTCPERERLHRLASLTSCNAPDDDRS
ncbi:helix-turn-helix domain-containing protein [Streptomyces winkii]|uniref:helix-turn-helix domain-containing protein n=1 Tax=Streptomyces winkii TaxID=3051178 RepID=UPI0028D7FC52|nr:MerR family transcriptional regulator [Streptomyces sp. DSM 40971]